MHRARVGTSIGIALLTCVVSTRPKEAAPSDWPVERFVRNLEARLAADPTDADTHYTLGRVHAFAFALERSTLLGGGDESFTWLKDLADQRAPVGTAPAAAVPTPAEVLQHLSEGLRHLQRACMLGESALHDLTLAWLLETGAHLADRVDTPALLGLEGQPLASAESERIAASIEALGSAFDAEFEPARRWLAEPEHLEHAVPLLATHTASANRRRHTAVAELLRQAWLERSIVAYRRCLDVAEKEGLFEDPMIQGPRASLIPREALEAYRRLVRRRGVQNTQEERRLAEADARWKALEDTPNRQWITPIVLSLADCPTLEDVLLPQARVPFDLDGDGVDELWPWPAPGAGWLVWDPEETGEILSGRQLFGSASGWLFFEDGYRVLDALDDDRDGLLRGDERAGIAVWFDRDGDGVSDRGEIRSLEALGIVALSTAASARLGPTLANPCGLELADGRVLPTWDWVMERESP